MTDLPTNHRASGTERTSSGTNPPDNGFDFLRVFQDVRQALTLPSDTHHKVQVHDESVRPPNSLVAVRTPVSTMGAELLLGVGTAISVRWGLDRLSASPLAYTPGDVIREPGHRSNFGDFLIPFVHAKAQVQAAFEAFPKPANDEKFGLRAELQTKFEKMENLFPHSGRTKLEISAAIHSALNSGTLDQVRGTPDVGGIAYILNKNLHTVVPQDPLNIFRFNMTERLRIPPRGFEGGEGIGLSVKRSTATAAFAAALSYAAGDMDHKSVIYRAVTPSHGSLALLSATAALPIHRNFGKVMAVASVGYLIGNFLSNDPENRIGAANAATQKDGTYRTGETMTNAIDQWVKVGLVKPSNLSGEIQSVVSRETKDQGQALLDDKRKEIILRTAEAETIVRQAQQGALPEDSYNEALLDLNRTQENLETASRTEPSSDTSRVAQRLRSDRDRLEGESNDFGAVGLISRFVRQGNENKAH